MWGTPLQPEGCAYKDPLPFGYILVLFRTQRFLGGGTKAVAPSLYEKEVGPRGHHWYEIPSFGFLVEGSRGLCANQLDPTGCELWRGLRHVAPNMQLVLHGAPTGTSWPSTSRRNSQKFIFMRPQVMQAEGDKWWDLCPNFLREQGPPLNGPWPIAIALSSRMAPPSCPMLGGSGPWAPAPSQPRPGQGERPGTWCTQGPLRCAVCFGLVCFSESFFWRCLARRCWEGLHAAPVA